MGAYTEEQVDALLLRLEQCFEQHAASRRHGTGLSVRARSQGHDVLLAAEGLRDLLLQAVSHADRPLLSRVFGGSCQRLERARRILDLIGPCEISSHEHHQLTFAEDQRFLDMQRALRSLESLLRDIGRDRPLSARQDVKMTGEEVAPGEAGGEAGCDAVGEAAAVGGGAEAPTVLAEYKAVSFTDTDGDQIEFRLQRGGQLQFFTNGRKALSPVTELTAHEFLLRVAGTADGWRYSSWDTEIPDENQAIRERVLDLAPKEPACRQC